MRVIERLEQRTLLTTLGVGANVDISKLAGYQAQGTIALDPTNPNRLFVASNIATGVGLFAAYSTDGGTNWTTRTMASGGDGLPVAAGDASTSFDQFGNLFLTYFKTSGATAAVVVRSINGGQTFSLMSSFANAADQPSIATGPGNVAGTGSVWVTWLSTTGLMAAGAQVTALNAVGAFGAAQTIPGGALGNFGDIAVGPGGKATVTYQDNTGGQGPSNIYVNLDPDGVGGAGFGPAILATTTNVGGFDFVPAQARRSIDAEAGLAWDRSGGAHNGRLYLVYTAENPDGSDDTDVLVRFSDNNGSTWSSPLRVNDDVTTRSQILPRIALDQSTGNVAVTWLDARSSAANDEVQLWGTVSSTGGFSFESNVQISAGTSRAAAQSNSRDFGDYTGLAFAGGAFYPIWPDNGAALAGNPDLPNFDLATAKVTVAAGPPGNDNFAAARPIIANSATGSNVNATKEPGEPDHAGQAGGTSVWWTWTAPTSHSYIITTTGSAFAALVGVYTGASVAALTTIAGNAGSVVFDAVAGATYHIAVDGVGGTSGDIALAVNLAKHTISGSVFVDRDSNGIRDPGEPAFAGRTVFIDANDNGVLDVSTTSPSSTDVPKAIPDVATTTSDLIVSGLSGAITDVNVTLNISHTFDSDLDVFLISPAGTRVELFTDVGGSGDNFSNTTLDDEAATAITAGGAPFAGTFKPEGTLAALDGQDPNGTWKLQVTDDASDDIGTLNSWSLTLAAAETSTSTDLNGNYSFPALVSGTYRLRAHPAPATQFLQTAPAGADAARVVTVSLGQSAPAENFTYFPLVFTGGNGNDQYTLSTLAGGATLQIVEKISGNAPITYAVPMTALATTSLTFNTGGGDDTFTLDAEGGNPIPAGGITLDAGLQDTAGDVLILLGSAGADDATFNSSSLTLGATAIATAGIEHLTFDGRGGLDNLMINSGTVVVPTTQHLQSLAIAAGAHLDLLDNDLILDYPDISPLGTWNGTAYDGVTGMIASGAIFSSAAASAGGLTTLGVAEAAEALALGPSDTALFDGQTVDATTVLVKYTWAGDATLDGIINVDDYGKIDFNVPLGSTGWFNGDFNYDGKINVDDYGIIDFTIPLQTGPL